MIDTSKATPDLFAALAKAQAEVENADKSSTNPHFKSKYADLAEVLNTVRPTFAKHGLSLIQSTGFDGSLVTVTTLIAHATGGSITSTAACIPAKSDAQGVGAATTYLRRYSLSAMCGIAQEDDDGQAAAHGKPPTSITEAEKARVTEWLDAIQQAPDTEALDKLGSEIAAAKLSAGSLAKIRAAFAQHKHALAKRAA